MRCHNRIQKPPFSSVHTKTIGCRFQKLHSGDRCLKPAFWCPKTVFMCGRNAKWRGKLFVFKNIRIRVDAAKRAQCKAAKNVNNTCRKDSSPYFSILQTLQKELEDSRVVPVLCHFPILQTASRPRFSVCQTSGNCFCPGVTAILYYRDIWLLYCGFRKARIHFIIWLVC